MWRQRRITFDNEAGKSIGVLDELSWMDGPRVRPAALDIGVCQVVLLQNLQIPGYPVIGIGR